SEPSARRSCWSLSTLSPRYSVMTAASDSRNSSVISATALTFSGFAMALLPEVSRHRVKIGPRTRTGLDTQVSRPRSLDARCPRAAAGAAQAGPCDGRFSSPAQALPCGSTSAMLGVEHDDRRSSVLRWYVLPAGAATANVAKWVTSESDRAAPEVCPPFAVRAGR